VKKICCIQLCGVYCCSTATARLQESQAEIELQSLFLSSSIAGWFPSSVAVISCLNQQKFEILQYIDMDQHKEKAPKVFQCNCNKVGSSS